jgi:hypothetical protein
LVLTDLELDGDQSTALGGEVQYEIDFFLAIVALLPIELGAASTFSGKN